MLISRLLALEAGDMTQIPGSGTGLSTIPSIAILMAAVVGTFVAVSSMVMSSMSMPSMGVMSVSSNLTGSWSGIPCVRGVMRFLLNSKAVLSLAILPLAVLYLLLLSL